MIVDDMGIDLGRREIGMAEQGLDHPQVGPMRQQMRGEGMAQDMRRDKGRRNPRQHRHILDQTVKILPGQMPLAPLV